MASTEPSNPPPPPASQPPPAPAPGASRAEWHAWRHAQRDYMRSQWIHGGGGPYGPWHWFGWGWFWGAALVVVGVYSLLSNLGLLGWLRGDILWPILLILLGVALLVSRGRGWWRW